MQPITEELVNKLIDTVKPGLCKGLGKPEVGQMCVEAAVCFAYGIPHSDNPPCVGEAVRSFKIKLNDANWSSNDERAKGMLKLSIAQLNSVEIDQKEFSKKVALKIINVIIADIAKKYAPELEDKLRGVLVLSEANSLCHELRVKCRTAAAAAAYTAAYAYAANAANAAYTADAAYAANAANAAAAAAAYAANAAAAAYTAAYAYAARDKVLNQAAQLCLEVLIDMKSPGCEFLYLVK